jgi:hypothetical protein
MADAEQVERSLSTLNRPSVRGVPYGRLQGETVMRVVMSVGKRAGSYVLATSSSSALFGGRRPSVLSMK